MLNVLSKHSDNESQYFRISLWPPTGFIKAHESLYKTLLRHQREVENKKNTLTVLPKVQNWYMKYQY